MKKIIATAGLATLGAVSLQAAYAPGLTPTETSKPWSVSATLRGFYDDNYATQNSHAKDPVTGADLKRDSFGIGVSPSFGLNLPMNQTLISLNYTYDMKWYEDRQDDSIDQAHIVNAKLSHAFSDRYKVDVSDSFVYAQEPSIVEPTGVTTSPLRSNGDVFRNTGTFDFTAELTRELSLVLGYSNDLYDYQEDGDGTRSPILDRMEHLAKIDARWSFKPETVGILGYQFGVVNHTNEDSLDGTPGSAYVNPDTRDSYTHYIYVGVDHTFNYKLFASARVGAQIRDYYNAPAGYLQDDVSPYADARLVWTYNPGSQFVVGVKHAYNSTDIAFQGSADPTMDQRSTTVYASVTHRITPKFKVSALGQAQFSEFQGGAADGQWDYYFIAGVNLTYQMNNWISAEAGYNYDRLDSDLSYRSFSRNRVYIGLRAAY